MKIFLTLGLLVATTLAEPPSYRQQSQADRTYYFAKQQEAEQPQGDAPYPASGWRPDGPAFELPQRQQKQVDNQYGAPAAPQNQYGAPAAPQNQYVPAPPSQYGVPAQQNQYVPAPPGQYAAPAKQTAAAQPQRQYGAPQKQTAQPQKQYGAPTKIQSQYGAPAAPQQQYGAPSASTDAPDYEDATTTPAGTESQAEPVNAVNELDEEGEVDEQQRQTGEYYVALPDGRLQRVQYVSSQDIAAMKYFAKIKAENVEPLRGAVYAYQPLQKLEFAPARLQVEPVVATPVVEIREKSQKIKEPLAAELAAPVVAPVSSSYTTYTANYQVPEQRYLVTF